MKMIVSIFYYFLICICCLGGASLAKNEGFVKEILFLVYTAMTVYAIAEMMFLRIALLKTKIAILRVLFLGVCIASTYALMVTTEEMILKKELNSPFKALDTEDIIIKSRVNGYLAKIKFNISNEQFLDLVDTLGFEKTSLTEFRFKDTEMRTDQENLMKNEDAVLCFVKDESIDEYSHIDIKYLLYDTETMIAYYEHSNNKGVNW